jgi:hypothetical protein
MVAAIGVTELVLRATLYSDFGSFFYKSVNANSYCQLANHAATRIANDGVIVSIEDGVLVVPKDYKIVTKNDDGKYVNHGQMWEPDRHSDYLIVDEKGQWAYGPVINDTENVKFRLFERNNRTSTAVEFKTNDRAYWKKKAKTICENANAKTDREKVEAVYTYLAENMAYNYDSADGFFITSRERDDRKALESKRGICVNFAHCAANLLNAVGVKTECVEGVASANFDQTKQATDHVWNRVRVDGEWYLVDTTFAAVRQYSHGKFSINDGIDSHMVNDKCEPIKDGHVNMQWCMNNDLINGVHLANTWDK